MGFHVLPGLQHLAACNLTLDIQEQYGRITYHRRIRTVRKSIVCGAYICKQLCFVGSCWISHWAVSMSCNCRVQHDTSPGHRSIGLQTKHVMRSSSISSILGQKRLRHISGGGLECPWHTRSIAVVESGSLWWNVAVYCCGALWCPSILRRFPNVRYDNGGVLWDLPLGRAVRVVAAGYANSVSFVVVVLHLHQKPGCFTPDSFKLRGFGFVQLLIASRGCPNFVGQLLLIIGAVLLNSRVN